MNKRILHYKGYSGSSEISFDDDCLHGQILFIDDLIIYEGNSPKDLQEAFIAAVDRYLEYCNKTGKPANKPYSGTFNVRVGPELHRKSVETAYKYDMTLNEFVTQSLEVAVNQDRSAKFEKAPSRSISKVATMQTPSVWEDINVPAFH